MSTTAYTAQGNLIPTGSGRPLGAYANQIMSDAVQDNVDPRLLVAIAFVEGKWGADRDAFATDNSFGLHNSRGRLANFTLDGGWATGIAEAASVVSGMIANGLDTVGLLYGGAAGSYCQGPSCKAFKSKVVSDQLAALGGSSTSLSSPCYQDPSTGLYYAKQ
jgi:hypothetical protein